MKKIINFIANRKFLRLLVCAGLTMALGTTGMYFFERKANPDFSNIFKSFWTIVVWFTSGFEVGVPITIGGQFLSVFIMLISIGIVGIFTATVASVLVEASISTGKYLHTKSIYHTLSDHIIIFGWSEKTDPIIHQLRSPVLKVHRPIVIVTERGDKFVYHNKKVYRNIWIIQGDPTDDDVLKNANVSTAHTAIILADTRNGGDPDAKTVLTAMAVKSKAPHVHTCAELINRSYLNHFKSCQIDEIVCVEEVAPRLLAQCVVTPGISQIYDELLSYQLHGNEVYRLNLPEGWIGISLKELAEKLINHRIIPVGVVSPEKGVLVNPGSKHPFAKGDDIMVIAYSKPNLELLESTISLNRS